MAGNEVDLPGTIAGPGGAPGSLEHETPESSGQSHTPAGLEGTAMQSLAQEPSGAAAAEPQVPGEHQSSVGAPEEIPERTTALSEPADPAPGSASGQAREPAKPRSLFPALAATAIAGALLGFGGTFALRYFEGPRLNAVVPDDRIAALNARIDAIEGKEDAAVAASRTALSAMETRVAAAESAAGKAEELATSAQADAQKAAASRPAAQDAAPGSAQMEAPDLEPLQARIAALEQKLAPLESALAAPKANLRAGPDRERAAAGQNSPAQAIAVVAESLLRKLDTGEQFSGEFAALEHLGVPQASLAPLRAVSGSGVLSEPRLTARFTVVAPKIVASESAKQTGENENFLDRLTRHAKGLVHVRRVGDAGAAGVQGLVARIENALSDHDLEAAYKAWKELPSAAVSQSEDWGDAAKARLDALNAARSIEADAVAVLGKPKP